MLGIDLYANFVRKLELFLELAYFKRELELALFQKGWAIALGAQNNVPLNTTTLNPLLEHARLRELISRDGLNSWSRLYKL